MVYIDKVEIQFKPWSQRKLSTVNKECHMDLHPHINEPKFYASYDRNKTPTCMTNLLAHDYGRIWHEEHKEYLRCNRVDKNAIAKMRLIAAKEDIKDIGIKAQKRIAERNAIQQKKEADHRPRKPFM